MQFLEVSNLVCVRKVVIFKPFNWQNPKKTVYKTQYLLRRMPETDGPSASTKNMQSAGSCLYPLEMLEICDIQSELRYSHRLCWFEHIQQRSTCYIQVVNLPIPWRRDRGQTAKEIQAKLCWWWPLRLQPQATSNVAAYDYTRRRLSKATLNRSITVQCFNNLS